MIIILLASLVTVLTAVSDDWPGIDPCKDEINCFGQLLNINVSNPENCATYFTCIDTSLYPQQCPTGLLFDQNNLICTRPALCHSVCLVGEYDYKGHIVYPTTQAATSAADEAKTSSQPFFSNSTILSSSVTQTISTPGRSSQSTSKTSQKFTTESKTSLQSSLSTSAKFHLIDITTPLPSTTTVATSPSTRQTSPLRSTQLLYSSPSSLGASTAQSTSSFKSQPTTSISTRPLSTVRQDTTTTSESVHSTTAKTSQSSRETTSLKSTTATFTTMKPKESTVRQTTTSTKTSTTTWPSTTATTTTATPTTSTRNIPSTTTSAAIVTTTPVRSTSLSSSSSSSTSSLFSSSLSSQSPSLSSSQSSRLPSTSISPSLSSSKAAISPTSVTTTMTPSPISSTPTTTKKQTATVELPTFSQKLTTSNRSPVTSLPTTSTARAVTSQTTRLTTTLVAPKTSTGMYIPGVTTGEIANPESFTTSSIADDSSQWTTPETTATPPPTVSSTKDDDTATTTAFRPDLSRLCNRQLPCVIGDKFGDVADCTRYFECGVILLGTKNYWFSMGCPSGQVFDPVLQECKSDKNGHCLQNICSPKFEHQLANISWPVLSSRPLRFLCSFRIVFVVQPIPVKVISWTLNGYAVTSSETESQRIQVEKMVNVDGEFYSSTLAFNPVTTRDSGFVECIVEYGKDQTSRQTEYFQVLPTPSVDLYPLDEVTLRIESVTLRCMAYYDDDPSAVGGYSPVGGRNNSQNGATGEQQLLEIVWYKDNQRINFTNDTNCTVNGVFNNASVLTCRLQKDTSFFCRTNFKYGFTDSQTSSIKVVQDNALTCKSEVVDGITWPQTLANTTSIVSCMSSSVGFATRSCSAAGVWEESYIDECVDKDLVTLLSQARDVRQGISINSSNVTESIAMGLSSFLSNSDTGLTFGSFNTTLTILQELGSIHVMTWNITKPSQTEIKSVLWSVSWSLNSTNDLQWRKLITIDEFGAVPVMDVVNIYGKKWAKGLSPGNSEVVNLEYLTVSTSCVYRNRLQNISFPQKTSFISETNESNWMRMSRDNIFFQNPIEFQNGDGNSLYYVSSSYYRNLDSYLPRTGPADGNISNGTVGSRIISLTVDGLPSTSNLSIPVRIVLENTETSDPDLKRSCAFWNPASKPSGSWSDVGCRSVPTEESSKLTICECDHLTNFAILFSPSTPIHDVALDVISIIGCIISIASLTLTLLLFAMRWKKIRSHHIVVLINLCIALIIGNIIFLVGVNRTSNKVACTVIAAFLHYFFLSAFFIMLIEGIQLLLYIACPFHVHRKRETTLLLLSAWILPLVVVAVSLGITKTEGYGGPESCWLSLSNGLLWAFVGPALGVILVNFVIFVIVLANIARTKRAIEQTRKQRIWATAWNVFMITPVLGVTWIFGVFSVNEDLVVFQYIFVIFNSLQGFFIFMFHGLCYRKPGGKSKDVSGNPQPEGEVQQQQQPHTRRPSYVRRPSRNKTARIENQKKRLRRHAINWVAIAAAAVASSADQLDLHEFDDESLSGGVREEYDEETFSQSLQPSSAANSIRSTSHNTTSTNRTDLLF